MHSFLWKTFNFSPQIKDLMFISFVIWSCCSWIICILFFFRTLNIAIGFQVVKTFVVEVWIRNLGNINHQKGLNFTDLHLKCVMISLFLNTAEYTKRLIIVRNLGTVLLYSVTFCIVLAKNKLCWCCAICRFWKLKSGYTRQFHAVANLPLLGHFFFTSEILVTEEWKLDTWGLHLFQNIIQHILRILWFNIIIAVIWIKQRRSVKIISSVIISGIEIRIMNPISCANTSI